ncbi:MAG: urea ABC transporter substrate-binding protein [Myxococcota bacterium]|nr:urea ABC transporter substrate-binding protein [Myxococcota bacterium]
MTEFNPNLAIALPKPVLLFLMWLGVALGCTDPISSSLDFDGEVKVGILHSRSGTMSISENTVAEAELLAINEINASGGLQVGEQKLAVIPIEEDGESDWPTFATRAAKLIDEDGVVAVFGGWTSASRKAMLPIFESRDHLLFYPIQYEGQECSRNVLYAGSVPNQQIEPALRWLFENRSRKLFLVGSDYVYPRTANAIINAQARLADAEVVGEMYLPLGSSDVGPIVTEIREALPSGGVIINTLNGDSNVSFFKDLKQNKIDAEHGYFIMSFSAAEEEVSAIGPEYLKGSLAVWNFFDTLQTPASEVFARAFAEMHGLHRVTSDPAEAAYTMVMLWALAVEKAGTVEVGAVRDALIGIEFDGPAGRVEVQKNHHLSKRVLIGEVQPDGSFKIIEDEGVIEPRPWSPLIEESRGYHCNHTLDRPDSHRFKPEDS